MTNMSKSNFPKDFLWGGALSACQAEGRMMWMAKR